MIRGVKDIRMSFHSRYLRTICIERLLQSEIFEQAWNIATEDKRKVAENHIVILDKNKLTDWIRNQLKENHLIEQLNMTQLRQMGQDLGVRAYATLTKLQLISAISQTLLPVNGCIKGEHSDCIFQEKV